MEKVWEDKGLSKKLLCVPDSYQGLSHVTLYSALHNPEKNVFLQFIDKEIKLENLL